MTGGYTVWIGHRIRRMKRRVVALVMLTEHTYGGKGGKEKKAHVLATLYENTPSPPLPGWAWKWLFRRMAGGWVDKICTVLNIVTDHRGFGDVLADPGDILHLLALPGKTLEGAQDILVETKQMTVDERIAELMRRCGIEKGAPPLPDEAAESLAVHRNYFKRSEFACTCGCGANEVKEELIGTLNVIREALGVPVIVASGTRCEKRNAKAGGGADGGHMTGDAADIHASGKDADAVWYTVRALWEQGRLPHLAGLGRYNTFTHVDIAPGKAVLREWDERRRK